MANINPDRIKMISIRTLKGNINSDEADADLDPKNYEIECTPEIATNLKELLVRIIFKIDIHILNKEGKKSGTSGSYTNEFIFEIEGIEDFIKSRNSGEVDIHPELGTALLSLAFSTSRGMIYTRTQGTILDGIILPVIDASDLQKAFASPQVQ
ncbi:hypothetical protein DRW42_02835 [Pedobacter miscanthi]|uniref:Uncharacterized protein n=2 Tax=Pedobacter miscanthi TaxID=2259170 RepID=A0A366LC35_9SPHI|nr:hypothetical protein DRW42_02835 [Pedobacter miscanthi]